MSCRPTWDRYSGRVKSLLIEGLSARARECCVLFHAFFGFFFGGRRRSPPVAAGRRRSPPVPAGPRRSRPVRSDDKALSTSPRFRPIGQGFRSDRVSDRTRVYPIGWCPIGWCPIGRVSDRTGVYPIGWCPIGRVSDRTGSGMGREELIVRPDRGFRSDGAGGSG